MDCKEGTPLVDGGGGNTFTKQPQSSYVQYIAVRRNVRTYRLKTPEELERERADQQGLGAACCGAAGGGAGPPYGLGANVKKMIFGCYTG
jgi:hypothetical protein